MPLKFYVCQLDDIDREGFTSFDVDGLAIPIVLAWFDNTLHAVSGMCPHENISFEGGSTFDRYIVCPGHGYSFDLKTGQCSHDRSLKLSSYQVHIDDKDVFVTLANLTPQKNSNHV